MSIQDNSTSTVKRKLRYNKSLTFSVDRADGATLSHNNKMFTLTFFVDRPSIPDYSNLIIESKTGKVISEEFKIDGNGVDFERTLTTSIEVDLNGLKSIATLLLNAIQQTEKK
ncbi:hypothetical protein ACR79M_08475 [Sphingobacterium spiritivorum]|uniref:hypothetical protein n=1 Tax=Sphingobacterium spiritivorum TaxID=258 RepID=UPI003DA6A877